MTKNIKRFSFSIISLILVVFFGCSSGGGEIINTIVEQDVAFLTYTASLEVGRQLIDKFSIDCSESGTKATYSPSYAGDSLAITKWVSAEETNSAATKTVKFSFREVYSLAGISILADTYPEEISLRYSIDGINYRVLSGSWDGAEFSARGQPAKYIELTASKLTGSGGKYFFEISDIRFFTFDCVTVRKVLPLDAGSVGLPENKIPYEVKSNSEISFDYGKPTAIYQLGIVTENGKMSSSLNIYYDLNGQKKLLKAVTGLKDIGSKQQFFEFDMIYTSKIYIEFGGSCNVLSVRAYEWNSRSFEWAATDGYWRKVADYGDLGYTERNNKYVGVFYFLWNEGQEGKPIYDVTKALDNSSDALKTGEGLGNPYEWHHWGESIYGYYLQDDEWVIRRDAQLLSAAGVDTLIFDNTNVRPENALKDGGETYYRQAIRLMEIFTQIRAEGGKTPQFMFIMPGSGVNERACLDFWWDNLYSQNLYSDLWFRWDNGKPMVMTRKSEARTQEQRDFFEFRDGDGAGFQTIVNTGGTISQQPFDDNRWNWGTTYPQAIFHSTDNPYEQMSASPAQNIVVDKEAGADREQYGYVSAFSEGDCRGRDFANGAAASSNDLEARINLGVNFQEQLDYVLAIDPKFAFITGWNEWIMYQIDVWSWGGLTVGENTDNRMFVDQMNYRYNRDIMPMNGKYGDATYYQLVDFTRRFKGVPKPKISAGGVTVSMKDFNDWLTIDNTYFADIGNTIDRDHPNFNFTENYVNKTGRNDIIMCKAVYDDKFVYFYVRTKQDITSYKDPSWMRLFIKTTGSGWAGYDYVINRVSPTANNAVLEKSTSSEWSWQVVADVTYLVKGREMSIAIPRDKIGLTGNVNFEFKWHDNMQNQGDINDFYISGDAAPVGRFNYVFRSTEVIPSMPSIVLGSGRENHYFK